jgi:hypothetical protein
MRPNRATLLMALFLAVAPTAVASTTRYVNGVTGSDSNSCLSATTACKTIAHAISLASSGDSTQVAAATYTENLTIGISLTILGSGATTTIIDGGGLATVVTISGTTAHVTLSGVTIRNGFAKQGGGIYNSGTLTINRSILSANHTSVSDGSTLGGGIYNAAVLTINNSTISGNTATAYGRFEYAYGGGIANNRGKLTINRSTISGNSASLGTVNGSGRSYGGGIANLLGTLTINTSTLSGNSARFTIFTLSYGGGISSGGTQTISNTTISGNSAFYAGGISGSATIQNSIVAKNAKGNCSGTMTSNGYNLSSDNTCSFNNTGDMNNTDPMLGPLQNNGGPTQTMALPSGSPAIDAGNPAGCTDGLGHLLKTDQRGMPRPDKEDSGGCDMGAYERQSD